ncbi:MAG: hypothetical protein GSR85_08640 [Desulfurococcales archaeon]|nr:hypothetical protein [Desulfurococcales archaeon]
MAKGGGKKAGVRSLAEQARYDVSVPTELVERARRELVRDRYLTPFRVAQRYNVTLSTARKLLKILEDEGLIVLFTPNRRSPLYLPKDRVPKAPPRGI